MWCGVRRPHGGSDEPAQLLPVTGRDTRAGTIELAIPKLREGSYFPQEQEVMTAPALTA
jgi:hypothetical protein